jgi:hypothetical protein
VLCWRQGLHYQLWSQRTYPPVPADCNLTFADERLQDAGSNWCYGYYNGNQVWSQKDAEVAKCITDLHASQDSACISKAGSPCDLNDSQILLVQENRLDGSNQLSEENAEAIRAAIQAAADEGVTWQPEGTFGLAQSIEFSHVADNGAGIRGVTVRLGGSDC